MQPGAGDLRGGDVHPADDEEQDDAEQSEDEDRHLAAVAAGVATGADRRPADPRTPTHTAPHRPRNRSTVATWVAETGRTAGIAPLRMSGTSGSRTSTVATASTRPWGRRHGEPSHWSRIAPSAPKS